MTDAREATRPRSGPAAAGEAFDGPGGPDRAAASGLAHVAAVSFLAARAAPSGAFWIALAGGVALARAAERLDARRGFGASVAGMLQSVAVIGPARLGGPMTQAITAPLLGRLEARRTSPWLQVLACAAIRLVHNAAATAFFIWVIVGGLDAYAGSYDVFAGVVPFLPEGAAGALALTGATLVGWAAFASWVQVGVYRRGLRRWDARRSGVAEPRRPGDRRAGQAAGRPRTPRFDPRAVAVAAAVAFALLLASTAWPVLAGVAAWLAVAWAVSRPERDAVPAGLALAAILALGALAFTLVGGLGLDLALRRASRAGLLVAVATWLRAAAGSAGLREVSRRTLAKLRRVRSVREASQILDDLGPAPPLRSAGASLLDALDSVRMRPVPIVDAVLGWVAGESGRFRPVPAAPSPRVSTRWRDGALVILAVVPSVALIGGAG